MLRVETDAMLDPGYDPMDAPSMMVCDADESGRPDRPAVLMDASRFAALARRHTRTEGSR